MRPSVAPAGRSCGRHERCECYACEGFREAQKKRRSKRTEDTIVFEGFSKTARGVGGDTLSQAKAAA